MMLYSSFPTPNSKLYSLIPAFHALCRFDSRSISRQKSDAQNQPILQKSEQKVQAQKRSPYFFGLTSTSFTNQIKLSAQTPEIPIFRLLEPSGELSDPAPEFSDEALRNVLKRLISLSTWDEILFNIQRQGRISFYIQNKGEETLQIAVGSALNPKDYLWCQYRELGMLMERGFTIDDAVHQCYSTEKDPGKGRQMPTGYCSKEKNILTICTPLSAQVPQASGCGYALKRENSDRIAVTVFGEGAASEGDAHSAMLFAAVRSSHTLFICRNNGYAIATPVSEQYRGDGIAVRGPALGIASMRVDGNCFFATYAAVKAAREFILKNRVPVLLELITYRAGHHSTSDDSTQYRPAAEASAWSAQGMDGIDRLRLHMKKLLKNASQTKHVNILDGMFSDVYKEEDKNLRAQREYLDGHLKQFGKFYDKLGTFRK